MYSENYPMTHIKKSLQSCCNDSPSNSTTDSARHDPGHDRIKNLVRERYAAAASAGSGCSCGCGNGSRQSTESLVGDDYTGRDGYEIPADLGLGCGIPTDAAAIQNGETVLDLGSGAGIDAFIAAKHAGPTGEVIGVDFTIEMVQKARDNAARLGYSNVRFVLGDIEDLPLEQESVDLVISNCVLNLVPDKQAAFAEMYRVLRPGGRFAISDIVTVGDLPDRLRESAVLYAGCVSGAINRDAYLSALRQAGFTDVEMVRERSIDIPDELLLLAGDRADLEAFRRSGGIASITVRGGRGEQ
jgi:SAM-dependent methyltransferase